MNKAERRPPSVVESVGLSLLALIGGLMGVAGILLCHDVASPWGMFAMVGTFALFVGFAIRVRYDVRQRRKAQQDDATPRTVATNPY